MGEPSRRGLFNLVGAAAIVLGLVGLAAQAPAFFAIYSEPVNLVTSYLDLVPLFTFIVGLAMIVGANVARGRKSRIGLLLATAVILGFFTWETSLAISAPVYGFPAQLSIVPSSIVCSAGMHTCTMNVTNSGAEVGIISGAGPESGPFTFSAVQISIPVGSPGSTVTVALGGSVAPGQTVTGYLIQNNGPILSFTAILQ